MDRRNRMRTVGEILAIGLVVAVRAAGMPLPAWPFLLVIAASFGDRSWRAWTGLQRTTSSTSTIVVAGFLGIGYQFFTILVEGPFLTWLFNEPETVPAVEGLVGNVAGVLALLALMIVFAIGEELAFRGYLLSRIKEWTGRPVIALGLSSLVFGAMHTWQNLPGVAGTTISGVVFGAVFLAAGSDVRAPIAAHLASNVTALVLVFFGLFLS